MNMTKEQIDERIKNIDIAVAITERRQDLWIRVYGKVNERYYTHIQELMDQREEMVALKYQLEKEEN